MLVSPSILSCDFNKMLDEIKLVSNADMIHCDVMDGHFVPNITFGAPVLKNIKKNLDCILDVHLMISDPEKYSVDFKNAGADYITFHFETVSDVNKTIDVIKSLGVKVGVSIKPNTKVEVLDQYLDKIDLVLVMSVEPGFGGQKFMPSALEKIKYLKNKKIENDYHYLIEVDGGINHETAVLCKDAGVEAVVAGTYVFKAVDPRKTVEELKKL